MKALLLALSFVIYDACPRCGSTGFIVNWLWQPLPTVEPCTRCGGLKVSPFDTPREPTEVAL